MSATSRLSNHGSKRRVEDDLSNSNRKNSCPVELDTVSSDELSIDSETEPEIVKDNHKRGLPHKSYLPNKCTYFTPTLSLTNITQTNQEGIGG